MTYRVEFLHGPDAVTLNLLLMDFEIPFGSHVVVEGEGLTPHTISWEGGTWTRREGAYANAPAGTPVRNSSGDVWVMSDRNVDDDAALALALRKILTSEEYVHVETPDEGGQRHVTLDGSWYADKDLTVDELEAIARAWNGCT